MARRPAPFDDPFFSGGMDPFQHMNRVMNSMFSDPFFGGGMMGGGMMGGPMMGMPGGSLLGGSHHPPVPPPLLSSPRGLTHPPCSCCSVGELCRMSCRAPVTPLVLRPSLYQQWRAPCLLRLLTDAFCAPPRAQAAHRSSRQHHDRPNSVTIEEVDDASGEHAPRHGRRSRPQEPVVEEPDGARRMAPLIASAHPAGGAPLPLLCGPQLRRMGDATPTTHTIQLRPQVQPTRRLTSPPHTRPQKRPTTPQAAATARAAAARAPPPAVRPRKRTRAGSWAPRWAAPAPAPASATPAPATPVAAPAAPSTAPPPPPGGGPMGWDALPAPPPLSL